MSILRRRTHAGPAALALLAVAVISISSCSNSDGEAGSGSGMAAAKTPYVGFSIQNTLTGPDYLAGTNAAIKAINNAGGVDGHPIKITTCYDENDPNRAATCARKAIDDSSVIAAVNTGSSYGQSYDSLLADAGMANFGNSLYNPADNTSPVSFPFNGGTFDTIASAAAAVQVLHAKKLGLPYIGVPAGASLPPYVAKVLGPLGGQVVGTVAIPVTATDLSAFAASEVSANPDVVLDGLTPDQYIKLIKAVRQQGGQMKFLIATGVFSASQLKKLIGDDPGIYLVDQFDHGSAGYKHFLADMKAFGPKDANLNDSELTGWVGVYAYAKILKEILAKGQTPSRDTFLAAARSQTAFDVEGLFGPPLNYSRPSTLLGGTAPRLFSVNIWLEKYDDGNVTPVSDKPFSLS